MNKHNHGNSVAVVTGGARGIGLGCAKALVAKGFDIVLVDVLDVLGRFLFECRHTSLTAEPNLTAFMDQLNWFSHGAEFLS